MQPWLASQNKHKNKNEEEEEEEEEEAACNTLKYRTVIAFL